MTTTDQLRARLKSAPAGYTYSGIPIFDIGDCAEQVITIGHVDKTAFAKAYDAYLDEVCGADRLGQEFTIEEFAGEARHVKAFIRHVEEFPHGEFEVVFDKAGDVDVTVRDNG